MLTAKFGLRPVVCKLLILATMSDPYDHSSGHPRACQDRTSQSGLSLIEVLVAFTILTIAGIGLFSVSTMSTTGNNENANQVAAAALATAKLEDLRNTSFNALASGSDGPLTAGGGSGGIYSRSWTLASTTISGVSTSAKTGAVTVSWTNGGSITMTTMFVKPAQAFTGISPVITSGFPTAAIKSMEQTK